ncbi:MAG: hypothetical protein IPL61_31650 [Myxococcales bacterium]|nr:hypothetical protein [Myxococcales bacterium]
MSVIVCSFAGWFQVRLATNPDPPDEGRGVSGYTFALPGEPDLDRLVRTRDPVAPRSHGPAVGLVVRAVTVDGTAVSDHPLLGGQVDLRSGPMFESVNDVVMAQGVEALEPFDLELTKGGFCFRRRDFLDPARPDLTVYTAPPELLAARRTADVVLGTQLLVEAIGSADAAGYRATRLALLQADLAHATDPAQRAGLTRRISELENTDPNDRRTVSMTFIESRTYQLNGPIELCDPDGWLRGLDEFTTFQCDIAMSAWDSDAMCGYAAGTVSFPTH